MSSVSPHNVYPHPEAISMGKLTTLSSYHVASRTRQEIAKGIMAIYLDRAAGFTFTAGHLIDLALPNLSTSDPEGQTRALTLASAPSEQQLMVAIRLRDTPFKRMLAEMPFGTTIDLEAPFGQFTLSSDDSRTIVLLAGGIGITPFRSMVVETAHRKFSHHLILLIQIGIPKMPIFLMNCKPFNKRIRILRVLEQ